MCSSLPRYIPLLFIPLVNLYIANKQQNRPRKVYIAIVLYYHLTFFSSKNTESVVTVKLIFCLLFQHQDETFPFQQKRDPSFQKFRIERHIERVEANKYQIALRYFQAGNHGIGPKKNSVLFLREFPRIFGTITVPSLSLSRLCDTL